MKSLEAICFILILGLSFFIAHNFIQQRDFPGGDEGTWMAPAARVLAGEGFTTHWLVKQDLLPYTLPRPDDLRFPGLVYSLALAFKIFGTSYATALGLILAIHLGFLTMIYLACRRYFDVPTALLTLLLTGISPLQLSWNTHIYSEGLFGLVLAGILLWSTCFSPSRLAWWLGMGIGVGLLGLVKLHALLFVPGFFVMYWMSRESGPQPFKWSDSHKLWFGLAGLFLVLSPWLIRNAMLFGSPVHSAQNAWIFRYTLQDPNDLGLKEFVARHGPLVFFKKLGLGMKILTENWDEYDHGLERIPLFLALIGVARRSPFFNPLIVIGFFLIFLGSAYTSYPFWIGIRFWSPLVPFVVAYGLFQIRPLLGRLGLRAWLGSPREAVIWALLAVVTAYPAFHPLKFYLRQPKAPADHNGRAMADYVAGLERMVQPDEVYLAASLGQLSFLTNRKCATIDDEYHMETWVPRMMATFRPSILALRPGEDTAANIRTVLGLVRAEGYTLDTLSADSMAVIRRINPVRAGH